MAIAAPLRRRRAIGLLLLPLLASSTASSTNCGGPGSAACTRQVAQVAHAADGSLVEPTAFVQMRRERRRAPEVACPPNDAVSNSTIDSDIIVTSGVCRVSNFTTTGTFLVSGEGSLIIDGNAIVQGGVEVTDASPGHVRLSGAKVKYVSLSASGNLEVDAGTQLGTVEVERSGNVTITGAVASDLHLVASGSLTVDNALLKSVGMEESGRLEIGNKAKVMSIKSVMSKGMTLSSMTVIQDLQVQDCNGDVILSNVDVNGPINILHGQANRIVLDTVTSADSVKLENCPRSDVRFDGVKVWGISVLRAGDIDLRGGSALGSFEVEASGNITISNASTSGVLAMQSGDLTITGAASLGSARADHSGRLTITGSVHMSDLSVATSAAISVSGNVSVAYGVQATDVSGDIDLVNVTLGGNLDVSKSRDAHVHLSAVQAPGVYLSDASHLTVLSDSSLGTIIMEKSGHTAIDGIAADVLLVGSRDLTVNAGAKVRNVNMLGSGHAIIGKRAEVARFSASGSESLLLDEHSIVMEGIEVSSGRGNIDLRHTDVGGAVTVSNTHGNVLIAASNMSSGGFVATNIVGSINVVDSFLQDSSVDKLVGSAKLSNVKAHDVSFNVVNGNVDLFEVKSGGETTFMDARGNVSVVLCEFMGDDSVTSHLTLHKVQGALVELNTFDHGEIVAVDVGNLVVRGNRAPRLAVTDSSLVTLKSNRFTEAVLSANQGGLVISDNAFDLLECLANDVPPNVSANNVVGSAFGQCSK